MARKRGRSRDEIRLMVLDAAEAIVAAEGQAGLSVRRIAAVTGCTVGMLYLVFRNLDDLIQQINSRTLDALLERLQANYPENPQDDPEKAMKALACAFIAYANAETPRWSMFFEHITAKGDVLPEWSQHKMTCMFRLMETALRALTGDEIKIARASHALWAGVYGICTLRIRQRLNLPSMQSPEEMAGMLIENFLRGLRG
ncbi:MAG: TetR/AcrR family transcriptional regulator [Candidatus Accumulibacter sp.]|nr:TetR/AcrR family transcriptional regulator [Accumulibacter sp.]